ncbi:putative prophage phiRv2 integrase [Pilimelia anulata]|uniref:Putative prophage phiRv2 integrase n=1 Tax=Pilimelia anulata TaxID=53371 RepID=A0A8J3F7I0_9ACTN|nr:site-specific integrase [Pilimelia anulata]GGJ88977.1 putative prophage phiRv2 integrase [Pilimelia anulata]
MAGRRRFGSIRKRDSGRYQVRYPGPDGQLRPAPMTFARKSEAERFLTVIESQMMRGEWVDPERVKITVGEYTERWITQRPKLRPRTVALYRWLFGKYIEAQLGGVELGRLDTPLIRQWRADLLGKGVSENQTAKAYRLLRAVLMTAVNEDELLRRNPCRIPGADQEKSSERPVLTFRQVFALADAVPARYRAIILVSAFGCLRWGEVSALQRQDIDADTGVIRIRQQYTEIRGVGLVLSSPKSRAGTRNVALPPSVLPALRDHFSSFVDEQDDALVFTNESGRPIWRGNFNKLVAWMPTVTRLGVPGLHFHDLRHTGNTFASRAGASTKELMARMGHDSAQAAMIYQHATSEADLAIAAAVDKAVKADRRKAKKESGEVAPKKTTKTRKKKDDGDDGMAGAVARKR